MKQAADVVKFGVVDERKAVCETHGEFTQQLIRFAGREMWAECHACMEEKKARDEAKWQAEFNAKRKDAAMRSMLGQAAIPARFVSRTLDSYQVNSQEQKRALEVATEYAQTFGDALSNGRSLVLCGLPGTGKTHLACGIALHLLNAGKTAVFTSAMNAIRRVRETYRKDSGETEREVIQSFSKPDLLIIDEVGQQLGTDAEKVTLFDIINARYEAMRPMIVISNLDLKGIAEYLGERAFDRLREGGGRAVQFTWASHRRGA